MVIDSTIRFNDRMDGPSVSLGSKLSNAKVSFAIFKRDIKRLLVNPVALVVTLGVCVIPSLYAWYNIVANWDPYGNTQGLDVRRLDGRCQGGRRERRVLCRYRDSQELLG